MWTHGMIASMYIVLSYNIVVILVTHLQHFKNSCDMQLQCNFFKNQTWLTTYVCMICINCHIEDPFSTHLQL